ncbi:Gfo/Idh/MocA family oxidoreductase [Candidatus Dojkabacteria bacterium]|jgi:UDP-N-acetyl-2-amino-2-deoxyglucuronate dehydrogenase|nr:Gfo/Idh/MocA family oxidoreductase [Candidatus Dojkabacteria bacterium]
MDKFPKRFSLTSCGFIAPTHIEAIRQAGGEFVGLNTKEDCVVINSPNYLHYQHIKENLNKICLVEKPLVLKSEQAEELAQYDNVFTVLQLRYHPLLKEIKVEEMNYVEMDISVYRDEKYHQGWKGDESKSGGILFNLGIHYFDLLFYLFGRPVSWMCDDNERIATGIINGDKFHCTFRLSTNEERENQRRVFRINGTEYNFSKQDNLAYENLHKYVYEDLMQGKGVRAKDIVWLIKFLNDLKFASK